VTPRTGPRPAPAKPHGPAGLPEPFRLHGEHIGVDLPGAQALFTTRRGGVSRGPYATLNLGLWTDDDPVAVSENRERVARFAGVARERFAQGRQVHGATVRRVTTPPAGEPRPADGQATALPGIAPIVLVADCLPVALAGGGAVAVLHAGWRGLASGLLESGVEAVRGLGAGEPLVAAIGPGAGPCCYEVGEDVHSAFAGLGEVARAGRNLDLKGIARTRLEQAGVREVHDVGLCTICADSGLFFSHRRDRGVTGRQAGLAWLA
jgi:YfiH family protein